MSLVFHIIHSKFGKFFLAKRTNTPGVKMHICGEVNLG